MERQLRVKGMSCHHCEQAVKKALESIPGISEVQANHKTGLVTFQVTRTTDEGAISRAITEAGYEVG